LQHSSRLLEKRIQNFLNSKSPPFARAAFLGAYDFLPNRLSAEWIIDKLAPELKAQNFQGEIHLFGKNTPSEWKSKTADFPFILLRGFVPELEKEWSEFSHFLLPQIGKTAGLRMKMQEALECRVPLLTNRESLEPWGNQAKLLTPPFLEILALDMPEKWAEILCAEHPFQRRKEISLRSP
jgi:hypothetical protein